MSDLDSFHFDWKQGEYVADRIETIETWGCCHCGFIVCVVSHPDEISQEGGVITSYGRSKCAMCENIFEMTTAMVANDVEAKYLWEETIGCCRLHPNLPYIYAGDVFVDEFRGYIYINC